MQVKLVLTIEIKDATANAPVNAPVNAPANAPVKLNKTQKKILPIILANKYATYDEMANTIGVDRTTIMRNIGTMKNNGIINRIGGDKNGYWEVLLDIKDLDK